MKPLESSAFSYSIPSIISITPSSEGNSNTAAISANTDIGNLDLKIKVDLRSLTSPVKLN